MGHGVTLLGYFVVLAKETGTRLALGAYLPAVDPDSAQRAPKSGVTPTPGALIAGKYRILRTLGEGGMGIVVEAHHLHLDQRVAIKFLRGREALDERNVMRFRREARAAAKVKSDHVAQIYDVGMLDDGTRYLVMEYLEGCDLAFEIERAGRLPIGQACSIAVQILDAISRAHEVGIVHRDLKPENIFLVHLSDGSRRVKVLDFGISKLDDTKGSLKLTGTSDLMGTPLYMAPEQMATPELVDGRADIWSIGCVLYEMLTGQLPFEAQSMPELCRLVMSHDPRHLCDVSPDAPPALGETVMRCLKRDVDERIASADELSALLFPYAVGPSATSRSFISGSSEIPYQTVNTRMSGIRELTQTTAEADSTRPRRRVLTWALGVLGFVGVLLGAAAWDLLPVELGRTFIGAADGAHEAPAVGAAQASERGAAHGAEEDGQSVEADPSTDLRSETANAEKAPERIESVPSESKRVPRPSVGTLPKKTADEPTHLPDRKSVAAPYDDFAEFGGRR